MPDLQEIWNWLGNEQNRTILAFIGTGLAAVCAAIWKIYERISSRSSSKDNGDHDPAPAPLPPNSTPPALPPPDPAALRAVYLRLRASEWRTIPLDVLDERSADPAARRLTLEQVYVALNVTTPRPRRSICKA